MKIKLIIILFLVCITTSLAQRAEPFRAYLYSEMVHVPGDSTETVSLSYRIPHNSLVFEKEGDSFRSRFRFAIEVFDSLKFNTREIIEEEIITSDYTITDSKDIYKEGIINFYLSAGNYRIIPIFSDLNSGREIKLPNSIIKISPSKQFYETIVVSDFNCGDSEIRLENYDGTIPFDGRNHSLLIPLKDVKEKLSYEILNNGELIIQGEVKVINSQISPDTCQGKIAISEKTSDKYSFIKLELGTKILEGEVRLNILNENREILFTSSNPVGWINKPRTLRNKETAISLLKIIDDNEDYQNLDKDDNSFELSLIEYWKKYDPTPNTSFNELMNEFYKRADYAEENFRNFAGKSGLESDRAKIYIQFGKPLSVDRFSNQKGKIIEIWYYTDNKKFSFIDEKGTGEFSLLNS